MTRKCDNKRCTNDGETTVQFESGDTRSYCDRHLNHLIQMDVAPFFSTVTDGGREVSASGGGDGA